MIDVAIIGAGPAGMSAAINIWARNRKPVIFGQKIETTALWKAEKVNNHLGMPGMSGAEMMHKFKEHICSLFIEIREGRVLQAMPANDYFTLNFENEFVAAKSIIIATGVAKKAKIKGEDDYLGRGVSYCATCDGMLYRGKNVVVVSDNEEGAADANFLSEICNKVYYIDNYGSHGDLNSSIMVLNEKAVEVIGDDFVTGLKTNNNIISAQGIFFIKASPPVDSLIYGLEIEDNAIKINSKMETSIPGVFACGDASGAPYQLSKAVGEGQVAGQMAIKYLTELKK